MSACGYCAGIGTLEATDMFCGAGGSSLGLEHVCCPRCGRQLIQVTQAINHWDLAVEAHNANFPKADHDVHDVEEVPARRFRRTELFWASPECVNHTSCKGKRDDSPEAQRSRATFKDIVRFTAEHHYDIVMVENVVEARLWCEHDKCGCGQEFNAWYQAMLDLGYEGRIVYFNSQFSFTPQSRDRMYVMFWRDGVPTPALDIRPAAWCSECEEVVHGVQSWKRASKGSVRERYPEWGRYGANYVYRCPNKGCGQPVAPAVVGARQAIDFSLPIERIGDRKYKNGKAKELAPNTRKRIKVGWENIGRRQPIQVQVGGNLFERDGYARVWAVDDPMRTVTGTPTMALVTPAGGREAHARDAERPMHTIPGTDRLAMVTADRSGNAQSAPGEPTPSVTGRSQLGLAMLLRVGGQAPAPKRLEESGSTITAHDRQMGLVMQNMENNVPRDVGQPSPPVTTGGNHVLVQVNRGDKGGAPRPPRDAGEPMRTIAGHGELGLVEFRGEHGTMRDGNTPMHTVTAQGTHHGMLVYNGTPGFVRDVDDSAGTITSRDKQSLLVPYYRTGVARLSEEPMNTVTTRDREALVITEDDIDDCYFRMLQWQELLRAQMMHQHSSGAPYQLTARRRNKRGQFVELSNELRTKMIGNAVSSPVATMFGHAAVAALKAA